MYRRLRKRLSPLKVRAVACEVLEDRCVLSVGSGSSPSWFESLAPASDLSSAENWIVQLTDQGTALAGDPSGVGHFFESDSIDLNVVRGLGMPGMVLVEGPQSQNARIAAALESHPLVSAFQQDRMIGGGELPNDPRLQDHSLPGLNNNGSIGSDDADIDAPEAWDSFTTGDSGVVVGVIDSGVDLDHPDLYLNVFIHQGEIPANLKTSLTDIDTDGLITFRDLNAPENASLVTERPGDDNDYVDAYDLLADPTWANSSDDDGNGFVDDLFGWDFTASGDNDPTDLHGHGTHVAGTIAAVGDNGIGVVGVAWNTSIMPLRFLDADRAGQLSDAISAISYATMMRSEFGVNMPVTNNSWGYRGEEDPLLRTALEANATADMLFVAAAGNGDALGFGIDNDAAPEFAFYPASGDLDNIVSVAATDSRDRLARFSNFGTSTVDLGAPGVGILSTDIQGDGYFVRSGTSMAAPHVAGVAALVWAENPEATALEVKAALLDPLAVDRPANLAGRVSTDGRLNAFGSLDSDTVAPRATIVDLPNVNGSGVTQITFSVEFTDNRTVIGGTIDENEIRVVDTFDGTELTNLELIDGPFDNAASVTAMYRLTVPGGFNDGDFEVFVNAGSVLDAKGNPIAETSIGTFNADTTDNLLRASVLSDRNDSMPPLDSLSLREAIVLANADAQVVNTIRLTSGSYELDIAGTEEDAAATGDLDITSHMIIKGAGADRTVIDANQIDRVFHVLGGGTLELRDLSITGGSATDGGGIKIDNTGSVALLRSTVSDNQADFGGGINSAGALDVYQSTIHHNAAAQAGGGIFNDVAANAYLENSTISTNAGNDGGGITNEGSLTLRNVTVADNVASVDGGGIQNVSGGTLIAVNTIIADNTAASGSDFSGGVVSSGFNLIGDPSGSTGWTVDDLQNIDPLLGPLQLNGGNAETVPVLTHALLDGSPAIDSGDDGQSPSIDQRGIERPQDASGDGTADADIGAVERYFATITGVRFHDLNQNGVNDPDEPAIEGEAIFLDLNGNGSFNSGEPSTLSGVGGYYSFTGLAPGSYRVAEILQSGWAETRVSFGNKLDLISIGEQFVGGNDESTLPALSANGRFVAFASRASNLSLNDFNNNSDIFLYDKETANLERISQSSEGLVGNDFSTAPSISADGRFVAFYSFSSNLAPNDNNGNGDIFVYDAQTDTLDVVSRSSDGTLGNSDSFYPSLSADGRFVAFESAADNLVENDTNGVADVFVFDRDTNTIERVSLSSQGDQSNESSSKPAISGDGRFVAFESLATNLVADDDPFISDIFVYDRQTNSIERISQAADGSPGNSDSFAPSISGDGHIVAFESYANNLVANDTNARVDIFVYNHATNSTTRIGGSNGTPETNFDSYSPSVSLDGRYIGFSSRADNLVPNDTNLKADVFIFDRELVSVSRVRESAPSFRTDFNLRPSISADGLSVAFQSNSNDFVTDDMNEVSDVFLADLQNNDIERVSKLLTTVEPNRSSGDPSLSSDGRFIVYTSLADNLVLGDTNGNEDVFVYDRQLMAVQRVSLSSDGFQGNSNSFHGSINANGRLVAFSSFADNLVANDSNDFADVFVFDRESQTLEVLSVAQDGLPANGFSFFPSINSDGRFVAFASLADNLVPNDTNSAYDVFVHDRQTRLIERVSIRSDGMEANGDSDVPSISSDGRFVAFASDASNLVSNDTNATHDVFVFDRRTGDIERMSQSSLGVGANDFSYSPSISGNGRFVAFSSDADNLVPNDNNGSRDIFVFDRESSAIELISVGTDGLPGDNRSKDPFISADGRYVAYQSNATNLVNDDTNSILDVFVFDRLLRKNVRVSVTEDGVEGNGYSYEPALSADGRYVSFVSASNAFLPVAPGLEYVFAAPSAGFDDPSSYQTAVGAGQLIHERDFGNYPSSGGLQGTLFDDENADGIHDAMETPLSGWTVFVDANDNAMRDANETFAVTNIFGQFEFPNLETLISYKIAAIPMDFWVQTTPRVSDGGTHAVYLDAGEIVTNLDFGFDYRGPDAQSLNDLTGNVFRDDNRNGVQDDGEPGLAGWTVYLDDDGSGTLNGNELSETTGGDGSYRFSGLPTGLDPNTGQPYRYVIRTENQSSLAQTRPLNNSLPAVSQGGALDTTQGLAVGKFNDDTYDDIIVASGDGLAVMLNDQAGGFLPPQTVAPGVGAAGAYTVATGHFDNGPTLDLAFTNRLTSNVTVMLGNGDGTFDFDANYFIGVWPHGLTTGDFNRDGQLDLAVGTESFSSTPGKVSILYGSAAGDGTFGAPQTIRDADGTNVFHLEAVQLTDDNIDGVVDENDAVDLVVANYARTNQSSGNVTVLYNGAAGFTAASVLQAGDGPASVAAADFNGDGRVDLAVANFRSDGVSIYENIGNGSMLKLNADLAAGTGPFAVAATDIDDDGDADILVANSTDGRLAVLRNVTGIDREITFGPPETFGSGAFPQAVSSSIGIGDFDGNDVPDVAISFNESASQVENRAGRVEVFLNSVAPGGYDITLDGLNAAPSLDFGFIADNAPPIIDPVDDISLIAGEAFSTDITFADVGDPGDWTVRAWYGDGNPTSSSPDSSWVVTNKLFTVDHVYPNAGSYDARIEVVDSEGAVGSMDFQVTVLEDTLRVTQFTPTASGFEAWFSGAIDVEQLNLYAGIDSIDKTPDVVAIGPDGQPVTGSVLWDAADSKLTFLKTGGPLESGLHAITLSSSADAFATATGQPLDGDANFVPGGDYVTTFTATPAARVVGLPDFARGPGQPVELQDGGIPVALSEADGLLSVDFTLRWDASLLNVTGINLATGTSGWFLQSNISAGEAVVTAWRNDPAPASGTLDLFTVTANVPQNAAYAAGGLLLLQELQFNEGSIPVSADAAVHKVAFLGDASGNARYFGLDASDIARVVVGIDSGFDAYPLFDPVIVADVTGNGILSGLDTSRVSRETLFVATGIDSYDESSIPPLPDMLPDPPPPGVDPTLQVTDGLNVAAGESVTVPVSIPDSASGIRSILQKVHYDANVFNVTTDDLRLGNLVSGLSGNAAWALYPSVDTATATMTLFAFSAEPLSDTTGEIFEIDVTASADAPAGSSRLDIDEQDSKLNGDELLLTAIDGDVIVTAPAAYVVDRKIFYNHSSWDGNDPAASAIDDLAIATDKVPLLPGESASFANYTSFVQGINGVMIDIANLPVGTTELTPISFEFSVGNSNDPGRWSTVMSPSETTIRRGAGDNGSDRVTLIWPDRTIFGTWLEVRVLQTTETGLTAPDVFYFGNTPGETGSSDTDAIVSGTDFIDTRAHPSNFLDPAAIDSAYDFNRDGLVNGIDLQIVRDYTTSIADSLVLISPSQSLSKSAIVSLVEMRNSEQKALHTTTKAAASEGGIQTNVSIEQQIDRLMASLVVNEFDPLDTIEFAGSAETADTLLDAIELE